MDAIKGDPDVLKKLGVGRRRGPGRWLFRLLPVIVLLAIGAGLYFWRTSKREVKAERFVTATVELGDLRETVTATGTLSPLDAVEVGAEVTGRVTQVHVDINDPVEEGQVLVELDTEQLSARLEESQAQLGSAHAALRNASATVTEAEAKATRTRELHKRGLASDQELESANAALERAKASEGTARAQVTLAQAGIKSAKTSLGKATIRSPITGIVLARSVEPGQTVTAGYQTPILFTLARDLNQMQLKIDVDEADVGKVRENQAATFVVDAYPKRSFASKVVRLSNLPKAGTTVITYEGVLTVDNSERLLRPGMTATATIVINEKTGVLSIPNAALRFQPTERRGNMPRGFPLPGMGRPRGGQRAGGATSAEPRARKKDGVFVQRGGELVRVELELGATDGRRTEILGGTLERGAEVVVDVAEAQP